MNVLLRELKATWRSILFWCLGTMGLIGVSFGKYDAIAKMGDEVGDLLALYPKPLLVLFGVGTFDITTAMGYFGVVFVFVLLMGGLHASLLGSHLVAKEEREKTAEFLYVRPMRWDTILQWKLLVGVIGVLALNLCSWAMSAGLLSTYVEDVAGTVAQLQLTLLVFQLFFLLLGFAMAACFRNKRAGEQTVQLFFVAYLIKFVNDLLGGSFLAYLTPFSFLGPERVINDAHMPVLACLITVCLTVGLAYVSLNRFPKRDIMQ